MKKENDKNNKLIYILNYISSACFYIVSVINFVNDDITSGLLYMSLGSTFLCLGTIWLIKDGKNKDKKQ